MGRATIGQRAKRLVDAFDSGARRRKADWNYRARAITWVVLNMLGEPVDEWLLRREAARAFDGEIGT